MFAVGFRELVVFAVLFVVLFAGLGFIEDGQLQQALDVIDEVQEDKCFSK